MSLLFDLYYNSFEVEAKIENILSSNDVAELKNNLQSNLSNENVETLKTLIFKLTNKLEVLINDEREIALQHGVKIGLELQKFFTDTEVF